MKRGASARRRLVAVAIAGLLCGCSSSSDQDWYGYYYDNVMINGAPATSRPFESAPACLAAMRNYTRNASRWAGFACARGCTRQTNGFLTDCTAIVR